MKPLLLSLAALTCLQNATFADISGERVWTGKNGATFLGTYANIEPDGKILFLLSSGKATRVSPDNLSEPDMELIKNHRSPPAENDSKTGDLSKFLPEPILSRANIPVVNQSDYGNKASDCVPSSFSTFLLWWDQNNFIPIDKRGDFARKAQYIHTRTSRYFSTHNNKGTSHDDMHEGIGKYFSKDLGDIAAYRIATVYDCDAGTLARFTQGSLATMLSLSVYHDGDYKAGHMVALADADPDGSLVIHTWGKAMKCKLDLVEEQRFPHWDANGSASAQASHYRLVFTSPDALPQWMIDQKVTFEIVPRNHDCLFVAAPYRFATDGAKALPPEDPRLANVGENGAKSAR